MPKCANCTADADIQYSAPGSAVLFFCSKHRPNFTLKKEYSLYVLDLAIFSPTVPPEADPVADAPVAPKPKAPKKKTVEEEAPSEAVAEETPTETAPEEEPEQ